MEVCNILWCRELHIQGTTLPKTSIAEIRLLTWVADWQCKNDQIKIECISVKIELLSMRTSK